MDSMLDELSGDSDLITNVSLIVQRYRRKGILLFSLLLFGGILLTVGLVFLCWPISFLPIPLFLLLYLFYHLRQRRKENEEYQNILLSRISKKCFGNDAYHQDRTSINTLTEAETYLNLTHIRYAHLLEGRYKDHPFESYRFKAEYGVGREALSSKETHLSGIEVLFTLKTPVQGTLILSSLPYAPIGLERILVSHPAIGNSYSIYSDRKENKEILTADFLDGVLSLGRIYFGRRMMILLKDNMLNVLIEEDIRPLKAKIFAPMKQNIYTLYDHYLSIAEKTLDCLVQ